MTDLSLDDPVPEVSLEPEEPASPTRRWLAPASLVPTYAGIALVAVGFVLIAVAWAKVAGLADVSLQMPYLVSAGFTGLALIMVGLLVIDLSARRQDGEELARQVERLTGVLEDLQQVIAETDARR